MLTHWIWLSMLPRGSDQLKMKLLEHFHDPEDIYYADETALRAVDGLTAQALEALRDKNLSQAEKILEQCQRKNIRVVCLMDADYPRRLRNISDPPLVLYCKGTLPAFDALPIIGVVGTRKATAYGLGAARRMGSQIARCGGVVVSGMAKGIDSQAMEGALTVGGMTVGVLGCGPDVIYPASSRKLYADTVRYGCILSEFPPETEPAKWNFPRRNRIISGLSCGVLVVEAPERSGALITARLAGEQGRDVFVIPGNIDNSACAGSNALLRDGAIMAASGWDVLQEYSARFPDRIRQWEEPEDTGFSAHQTQEPVQKQEASEKTDKKPIDNPAYGPYSDRKLPCQTLTAEERLIVNALSSGERTADEVVAETGLTTGRLLAALTMLELKGLLRRKPGKRIELIGNGEE